MLEQIVCDDCKEIGNTDPALCHKCTDLHIKYAESMGKPSPITSYEVSSTYYASASATIQLPLYKTWDDVEYWSIRYGTLYYKIKGEEKERSMNLNEDIDMSDQKTPVSTSIYTENYEQEIDSHG